MKFYYIAYDIDISSKRMLAYFPSAKIILKTEIRNTSLCFCGFYERAYPTLRYCYDKSVPAIVWELEEKDMQLLDAMHHVEECYKKVPCNISGDIDISSEVDISGITYLMQWDHIGMPSEAYLEIMLDGYEEHGFDPTALEEALDKAVEHICNKGGD